MNLFYDLESQATSKRSNHPWIIFQGRTWTYAQAYDIVLRYGAWLKSLGVEKDEIVAIDFVNSDTFIWVWFGLWSIGAKPAFINYNLTGKPLIHTIETSTARLVLVDEAGRDKYSHDVLKEHGFIRSQEQIEQKCSFETDARDAPLSVRNQTVAPRSLEAGTVNAKVQRQLQIIQVDNTLKSTILAFPPTRQQIGRAHV